MRLGVRQVAVYSTRGVVPDGMPCSLVSRVTDWVAQT